MKIVVFQLIFALVIANAAAAAVAQHEKPEDPKISFHLTNEKIVRSLLGENDALGKQLLAQVGQLGQRLGQQPGIQPSAKHRSLLEFFTFLGSLPGLMELGKSAFEYAPVAAHWAQSHAPQIPSFGNFGGYFNPFSWGSQATADSATQIFTPPLAPQLPGPLPIGPGPVLPSSGQQVFVEVSEAQNQQPPNQRPFAPQQPQAQQPLFTQQPYPQPPVAQQPFAQQPVLQQANVQSQIPPPPPQSGGSGQPAVISI